MKKVVILTGAGISAESGISTFRDSNGLWENHAIEDVASPAGWKRNPQLVLDFYNQRRRQLKSVFPNAAHEYLVKLESQYKVSIITQNVDDLHERAGSSDIIHLHGSLLEARSEKDETLVYLWKEDIKIGDLAEDDRQLRPNIVWFGEMVPNIEIAIEVASDADIFIIIGTSLAVYPAASLIDYVPDGIPIYLIDPDPAHNSNAYNVQFIQSTATEGVQLLPL